MPPWGDVELFFSSLILSTSATTKQAFLLAMSQPSEGVMLVVLSAHDRSYCCAASWNSSLPPLTKYGL